VFVHLWLAHTPRVDDDAKDLVAPWLAEVAGRFSVGYKKRYGESPTQTLWRAGDLHGPSADSESSGRACKPVR
jgi:hypothetical protein